MNILTLPLGSSRLTEDTDNEPKQNLAQDCGAPPRDCAPLRTIGRPDSLTSQHVEVGIVLNAMLGFSAANEYLTRHEIDDNVIVRVLSAGGPRRGEHDVNGIRVASQAC